MNVDDSAPADEIAPPQEPVVEAPQSIAHDLRFEPTFEPPPPEPADSETQATFPDAATKPAAIAQVLGRTEATPSSELSADAPASEGDAAIGDFIRSPSHARDDVGGTASTAEPEPLHAARAAPARRTRSEHRSWTNEPVLLAILLVALLVLAVDSYFMIRLNGLSDRLNALSARAATPVNDRPWVGTDTITTANFSNGGQPITTLHLINSGRTPATDLRSNTVGSLRTAATPPPDIPKKPGPLATTGMLLPNTGGKLTFFANTRALTAAEAGDVRNGKYVLWLAGRLDYRDKGKHVHTTTFRYRYNAALGSFVAAPNGNSIN
jgi:hypothetical protein